jgi:tripartite-type tricarboxylate transporter receptor subunit TctC
VPTVAETVPGVIVDAWFVIVAPTGTPAEAVRRLNQEINELLKGSDIGDRFARFGLGTSGAGTPESAAVFIRGEQEKWRALAKELNIEAQ